MHLLCTVAKGRQQLSVVNIRDGLISATIDNSELELESSDDGSCKDPSRRGGGGERWVGNTHCNFSWPNGDGESHRERNRSAARVELSQRRAVHLGTLGLQHGSLVTARWLAKAAFDCLCVVTTPMPTS